jgi:hypothetical protein
MDRMSVSGRCLADCANHPSGSVPNCELKTHATDREGLNRRVVVRGLERKEDFILLVASTACRTILGAHMFDVLQALAGLSDSCNCCETQLGTGILRHSKERRCEAAFSATITC